MLLGRPRPVMVKMFTIGRIFHITQGIDELEPIGGTFRQLQACGMTSKERTTEYQIA